MIPFSLGRQIRTFRLARGMTQSELAQGLVSPSMISQIESDRANPSYNLIVALSERLETGMDSLFTDPNILQKSYSYYQLACAYMQSEQFDKALMLLKQIDSSLYKLISSEDIQCEMIRCKIELGELNEAEATLSQLKDCQPQGDPISYQLKIGFLQGRLLFVQQNYRNAIVCWKLVCELATLHNCTSDFYSLSSCEGIGQAFEALADWERAADAYQLALRWTSNEPLSNIVHTSLELAENYIQLQSYHAAAEQASQSAFLAKSLKQRRNPIRLNLKTAFTLAILGRYTEAAELLNQTIDDDMDLTLGMDRQIEQKIIQARAEFQLGDMFTAIETLHKVLGQEPTSTESAHGFAFYGYIQLQLSMYAEAEASLWAAAAWFEEKGHFVAAAESYQLLSVIYKAQEKFADALHCYERMHQFQQSKLEQESLPSHFLWAEGICKIVSNR